MSEVPRYIRRRLFQKWVHDPKLRQRYTFLKYIQENTDAHGYPSGEEYLSAEEYEKLEREAIQAESA